MFFWLWSVLALSAVGLSQGATPHSTWVNGVSPVSSPAAPSAPDSPAKPAAPAKVAEPQVPSGRFTTATEVKPILTATRNVWVAVREYEGRDLVYVTQILSWRCGLVELTLQINNGTPEIWDMPPCHDDTASPNAITPEDGLPYRAYPLGSVQSVTIGLTYDDLSTDSATFQRDQVLMP
jgi:hypothetical protein